MMHQSLRNSLAWESMLDACICVFHLLVRFSYELLDDEILKGEFVLLEFSSLDGLFVAWRSANEENGVHIL